MLPREFRRASRNQSLRDLCLHMWVDVVVVVVVVVVAAARLLLLFKWIAQ